MPYPESHDDELSLDNETLATTHDAIVLTVGGVLFRGRDILERIYFRVNIDEQMARDRKIKPSTWRWWMEQSDVARSALFDAPEVKISTGRAMLREVGAKAKKVWARPAMFDLPMLRHLFGQDLWDDSPTDRPELGYRKENDLGTLVQEFDPHRVYSPSFVGEAHNALDDAIHHQKWLMNIRELLHSRDAYDPWTVGGSIWNCSIGEHDGQFLVDAADAPMRVAVERAYKEVTGQDSKFTFSGWRGRLRASERQVYEPGFHDESPPDYLTRETNGG